MLCLLNPVMLKLNTYVNPISILVSKAIQLQNKPLFLDFPKFASKNELIYEIIPWVLAGAGYPYLSERRFHKMADSPFPIRQNFQFSGVSHSSATLCECLAPSSLSLKELFNLSTLVGKNTLFYI